ncbi:DUF2712 domain-containing protein [Terribacillus saccharophilus]|uniref:DUF2712 domain-containing protein n=1 Tax=Terribacillus saccharophilus TaxID=361277 RepID=UPI002989DF4C|nr:DUF2712 domain-containing protein [Terribacillus saccharophilus]MCM3225964.1 DUF2712 domain-containing protein [Terribacillus saccharophilus]
MRKSGIIKLSLVVLTLAFLFTSTKDVVLASNDNHSWAFSIQPKHYNNFSDSRYRQTSSKENPWKVKLNSSGEGKGTITTFWLGSYFPEESTYARASVTRNVYQGRDATYTAAYWSANKKNVALGAENNNYSTNSYWASGIWDEETW